MTRISVDSVRNFIIKITGTFLGVGYSPWAPGTLASAAGLALAWFLGSYFPLFLVFFLVLGFAASGPATRLFFSGDPQCFVMDEVCGMMISLIMIPRTVYCYLAGFILFRVFDIAKPWPISRIQKSKHPSAIMWDDVLAGIFANIILRVFLFYSHQIKP